MMILNLIFLIYLNTANTSVAHAEDAESYEFTPASPRFDDQIVHKHDLATELGLRDPDSIFSSPRTFSSEELNTMQLDPLKDEADEPVATKKN